MTGWRIGYCGGPKEIVTAMATIQGQSTSNAASMSQKAAIAALTGDQALRRDDESRIQGAARLHRRGAQHPARRVLPAGQRRVLCLCRRQRGDGTGSASRMTTPLPAHLINTVGVAVVPGSGFGAPGHIRLSFACSREMLEKAVERMRKALKP